MSKLIVTDASGAITVDRRIDDGVAALLARFVETYDQISSAHEERFRSFTARDWKGSLDWDLQHVSDESMDEESRSRLVHIACTAFMATLLS